MRVCVMYVCMRARVQVCVTLAHVHQCIRGHYNDSTRLFVLTHSSPSVFIMTAGYSLLVWTSMNIDGYMHRFKAVSD